MKTPLCSFVTFLSVRSTSGGKHVSRHLQSTSLQCYTSLTHLLLQQPVLAPRGC